MNSSPTPTCSPEVMVNEIDQSGMCQIFVIPRNTLKGIPSKTYARVYLAESFWTRSKAPARGPCGGWLSCLSDLWLMLDIDYITLNSLQTIVRMC